jgi:hypothetical protein
MDKLSIVRAEVEKLLNYEMEWMDKQGFTDLHIGMREAYKNVLSLIDSTQKSIKFKVGDKVISKTAGTNNVFEITDITDDRYIIAKDVFIPFEYQDRYELVER